MKISIIVPVYNGERFLEQCLNSLLKQTYTDIEIIIVNDGSKDQTQKIAEKYQSLHENITVIYKKNAGLPQARKTGIEHACGDYIGFVDVDDWVEPDMFEILYSECTKNEAQIACCGFFFTYEHHSVSSNKNENIQIFSGKEALIELNKRQRVYPYAWNKLYKQEVLQNIVFPVGNFVGEDYAITTQVLSKVDKVVWLPKPLYHYVQSENSMCRGGYSKDYIIAYENYEKNCQRLCNLYPNERPYFENYFLTELASFVVAMGKNNQYNYDMLKKIKEYAFTHKKQYLHAEYIEKKFKYSIQMLCIHYKILILCYKFIATIKKLKRNRMKGTVKK